MRKSVRWYLSVMLVVIACSIWVFMDDYNPQAVKQGASEITRDSRWNGIIAGNINSRGIKLQIDGKSVASTAEQIFFDDELQLYISSEVLSEWFLCAANFYSSNHLILEKFNSRIVLSAGQKTMMCNDQSRELPAKVLCRNNHIYVPSQVIEEGLSYAYTWDVNSNTAAFANMKPDERVFPYIYDYRAEGRMPEIKNQSTFGTCWAFASLMALETTLKPETNIDFSEDHMSINNNFSMTQNDGGEYTMAIAYLASWTGPVLEEDDPYGDGYSPEGLEAVVHLQEAQVLESKNYDNIKKSVFLYGGVQSSLYMEMPDSRSTSIYYDENKYSYCYIGPEKPNHDIVIIGWDDTYPASNFTFEPEGDGAFICANSWGEEFGDRGVFYVSYYDSNIGVHNVIYTGIEGTDNYDNIYQTDLCGWVGQIGYDRDYAYFANVYTANDDESLEAVAFYSVAPDSSYEIYIVEDFKDEASFSTRRLLTKGTFGNAGYYTVTIPEKVNLEQGGRYAIVVYIQTPNSKRPVAVEYRGDAATASVVLDDGEGYISPHGDIWIRTEETKQCNVCLKMFTNKR